MDRPVHHGGLSMTLPSQTSQYRTSNRIIHLRPLYPAVLKRPARQVSAKASSLRKPLSAQTKRAGAAVLSHRL